MFKFFQKMLLVAALCVPWWAQAQTVTLENYGFTTGVDTSKWVDMTSAGQILTPSGVDGLASSVLDIGFSFPFGSQTYTQYSVNTDGNLRLDSTVTATGSYTTPFSSSYSNQNNPKINAFGCDGYGVSGSHYVKALLQELTDGDTMLAVEFCMGTYNSTTRNELYKWQIHLYSNGNIDIVFPGASDLPANAPNVAHQCGLCVNSSDGWIISSSTNTAEHFTSGTTITNALGTWFDANRYYSFVHPSNISCSVPTGITVSNISATGVTLSWTAGGSESLWEVTCGNQTEYTTTNSITLSGLEGNTPYIALVRAICGAGDTSYALSTSFRTACAAISSLPYSNDFEDSPAYSAVAYAEALPYCWHRINDATGTYNYYPYINTNSTYLIHGGKSMYWYHTTSNTYANNMYAVLPEIDLTAIDINDLTLSFYAKTTATAAPWPLFIVGVLTDPTDTTGFTPVDTITLTNTATLYAVNFANYNGTGAYIAIRCPRTSSARYCSLDDIYLTDEWCDIPGDVTTDASLDEITLSWESNGGSSFTVYLGTDTVSNVTDTFYTFQGLTSNTLYVYGVATECSNGISSFVTGNVRTLCGLIDSLPYSYGFEDMATGSNTVRPDIPCWHHLNNATQYFGLPYVSSTSPHTGSRNLYWYNNTATTYGDYQIAVLPAVDTNIYPISNLQLSFWARPSSTSYSPVFQVGVMTDPTDASTFQLVDVVNVENVATWQSFTASLGAFTGSGNYVAVRAVRSSPTWIAYTDDFTLEEMPSCQRSEDLTADSLSYDYARLTWANYSDYVGSYHLYYSTQPVFSFDTCPYVTVYDTVYEAFGLNEETDYYWTVIADCGGGDTSLAPEVEHFRTRMNCGENSINIVETIGEGSSSGTTYFAYNSTSYAKGYSANIFTAEEMMDMGIMTSANLNSVSVRASGTACTIPNLKVYAGLIDTNQFSGAVDTSRFANMTLVYDGAVTTTANEWVTINFDTTYFYDGSSNLMLLFRRNGAPTASGTFYYTSTTPIYSSIYGYASSATGNMTATRTYNRVNMMFNMCAEVPTCPRPMEVNVDNISASSATFTWETGNGSYQYVIGPYDFDPNTATAISTADTFAVVTGLTPNTSYDFYVRNVCAGNMISDWSLFTRITTPCAAQALPYTEDFENYGTGSNQSINPCWEKGTNSTTAYPYPYGTNAVNGARSLYFYAYASSSSSTAYYSYAALPMMQAPIDTLMVSFSIRRYTSATATYTSHMLVGVMSDPTDISTFVAVDTIDLYTAEPGSIHNFEVAFDGYTGNGQFIAFYDAVPPIYGTNTTSYSYIYLDDITVDYIPSCRRIIDIDVINTTENSATISWTDRNSNGQGYVIEYGPEDFTLGNGTQLTTIDTFITLTGLSASTGYDFYVRTICSSTENGPWSFATNFRTVCGIYNVPFTEDFESYQSGSSYGIDPCWTKATNNSTAYPYPYSTAAINGARGLYFYSYHPSSTTSTAYYSYVALPEFNIGVDSIELSFKMKRYGTTSNLYTSRVLVGVMTDPTDISTFVGIDTVDLQAEPANSIHDIVVNFSSYTGTGKHIAIYNAVPPLYGTGTYSYSYVYLDDINVDMASPCGRPHNLHADVTANTITMHWTDTVNATQWQIEYGPTGFQVGTGTVLTVNQNPCTITGLTPSTLYDVYVRSMCTSGAVGGNNTGIFTVSTSQVPATLPYYYNFEDATEWNNWQTVTNNNVAWYRGIAEAAEGNYSLYVSTDSGATCNSLHSTITNAAVYRDIDFGSTPSSFEVSFLAKSAGVNDGNYEGINVMLVDPTIPVSASSTSLTSPWGTFNVVHVVRDTNWTVHTLLFDNVSGVKRLAFNWFTSTTSSHPVWNGAGAIDSLVIKEQSCVRPVNTSVTNIGPDFVSLQWDGPANANYIVRLRETTGTTNIDNQASTNSITVNNLNPMTHYYVWVYKVCDANNISYSAPRIEFTTTCSLISAADTMYEDFDSVTATTYSAAGTLPDCWEGYTNGTSDVYIPHVTDGGTYSYSVTGNAVTMTSGSGTTYGNTKILRLPKFAEPVRSLTLKYWYCTESNNIGTLYVGYMTGFDYENDFVPLVTHPASAASYHSGNGPQPAGTGVYDTVSFDSVPSNALFIAFKWFQDGTFYSVCIDNVEVTSGDYCATPEVLVSSIDYDNANIVINGVAPEYEVGIKLASEGSFDDDSDTTITTNTYDFTGLTPLTTYQYRVRGICDTAMISDWYIGTFTTDSLPCFTPTGLQTTNVGYTSATLAWNASSEQNHWTLTVWNTAGSVDYDVTGNAAYTVTGLTQDNQYYAAVKAICGNGAAESEYSDTIQFTTDNCEQVTGVTVNNITENSAVVSWQAATATSYEVDYGPVGHGQGQGTTVKLRGRLRSCRTRSGSGYYCHRQRRYNLYHHWS